MAEPIQDSSAIDGALANLKEMMSKDGYILSWAEQTPGKVTVEIEAGSDACEDCLAPQNVIEAIMTQALDSTPYSLEKVRMPTAH